MLVSIIVPVYNSPDTLQRCLDALSKQNLPPDICTEIILVNDDTHNKDLQLLCASYPNCTYICSDNNPNLARTMPFVWTRFPLGPGAARNSGVSISKGDYLLFTDADCIPEKDWIVQLLKPMLADPAIAAIKGAYRSTQPETVARFVQQEYAFKTHQMSKLSGIDFIDTYSAAFRRSIFLEHQGFNPHIKRNEDHELSFRVHQAGHKLAITLDARVAHQHVTTLTAYFRRKFELGVWKISVLVAHPNKTISDSHTPTAQRLQLLFGIIWGFSVLTALVQPTLATILLWCSAMLWLVACIPMTRWLLTYAPKLAGIGIGLLFIRTIAQILGLVWGCVTQLLPALIQRNAKS